MIDPSKDVHDRLVVHPRRLEDRINDPLVREDNIVGERRMEGPLRGTDGLRSMEECISRICSVFSAFCASRDSVRGCWICHG